MMGGARGARCAIGEEVGGVTIGGISKETGGGGSGGSISHGCSNASGNVMEGVRGERVCGVWAIFLSTRSTIEGGCFAILALICQTDRKFASVLHVAKASS